MEKKLIDTRDFDFLRFSYCKLLEYDFELGRLLWDLGSRARYFFDKMTEAFRQVAMEMSDYSLV